MSHTQRKWLLYLIALTSIGAIIFNLFQIIIILSGGYNRNPNIESELLQTLDAIGLTVLWFVISSVILFITIRTLRR
ncbi:MAG: hypothetical protein WBC91_08415 [Phototrophicaceae bacterium]